MTKLGIQASKRLYSFLLWFYPPSYRQEFGSEMQYVFSQSLKEAYAEHGGLGLISIWVRTMIDASKSIVTQHLENTKGGSSMKEKSSQTLLKNTVMQVALATVGILFIPFLSMQFGGGFDWSGSDFVIAGVLIFGILLGIVLAAKNLRQKTHLALVGLVIAALLVWLYIELAVGLFTNWGS